MRSTTVTVMFWAMLAAGNTLAAGPTSMEKVKTGILPSGGFYRLYDVSCTDQSSTTVASLERGARWCLDRGGDLDCYRSAADASVQACSQSAELAAAKSSLEGLDTQK